MLTLVAARSTPDARVPRVASAFVQICNAFIACPELQLCDDIDLDDFTVFVPPEGDRGDDPDPFVVKLSSLNIRIDRGTAALLVTLYSLTGQGVLITGYSKSYRITFPRYTYLRHS